jgi:hypothetical protein
MAVASSCRTLYVDILLSADTTGNYLDAVVHLHSPLEKHL